MAEEGVHREPVSASNSLIYGKIQGISANSDRRRPELLRIFERFRTCRLKFPVDGNRELIQGEQGIHRTIRESRLAASTISPNLSTNPARSSPLIVTNHPEPFGAVAHR